MTMGADSLPLHLCSPIHPSSTCDTNMTFISGYHRNEISDPMEERKLRKRTQNRANQKARRLRLKDKKLADTEPAQNPYHIHSWRLEATKTDPTRQSSKPASPSSPGSPKSSDEINSDFQSILDLCSGSRIVVRTFKPFQPDLSLPADHLLRLVHWNVFRGLFDNKVTLGNSVVALRSSSSQIKSMEEVFSQYSLIIPKGSLPPSLELTQRQMSLVHPTWINLLPFPRMRDNLIRWEAYFNHNEFIRDLIGNLLDPVMISSQSPIPSFVKDALPSGPKIIFNDDGHEATSSRNGFVLWGDPFKEESWEATPGFLRKWSWTVEGCEKLIQSTNRWRMLRGDKPIQILTVDGNEPDDYCTWGSESGENI